jgi:predicted RNA-binding Zn-ribbon protein involved in translation (DUF1610 family)
VTESCVFDHRDEDGVQVRAAPGRVACTSCTDRVWRDLSRLQLLYDGVTDVDELIPGGSPDSTGGRSVPGPRSPAVDALLVHTDPRSATGPGESPAALASIAGWARTVREDTTVEVAPEFMLAVVPRGRVSMGRELAAIRGAWPWVTGQPWFLDFATEVRGVINALLEVRRMRDKTIRIGGCPKVIIAFDIPEARDKAAELFTMECGATLRVRPADAEIRCKNCGTIWPRSEWRELGSPWADYATLSADLDVPVGTLWRWSSKDGWEVSGTRARRLVLRADALDSYEKYRGNLLGEAG